MSEGSSRKFSWILLTVILTGLVVFALFVLVLRSGGVVRALAIFVALLVLYAGYESIRAINRK